jgi:hypothetical protein
MSVIDSKGVFTPPEVIQRLKSAYNCQAGKPDQQSVCGFPLENET